MNGLEIFDFGHDGMLASTRWLRGVNLLCFLGCLLATLSGWRHFAQHAAERAGREPGQEPVLDPVHRGPRGWRSWPG